MNDTKARCWLHGFRIRVYNDPGSSGGSFMYPTGDGQEWGSLFVDLDQPWETVCIFVMHELQEYWLASSDLRLKPDSIPSMGSECSLFIVSHDQFTRMVDESFGAWFALSPKLKKAWKKWQKKMEDGK